MTINPETGGTATPEEVREILERAVPGSQDQADVFNHVAAIIDHDSFNGTGTLGEQVARRLFAEGLLAKSWRRPTPEMKAENRWRILDDDGRTLAETGTADAADRWTRTGWYKPEDRIEQLWTSPSQSEWRPV